MNAENQAEFKGWARVEVMGHQSHIGYVTTEAYGQAVLFRIDRPEIPEAEETLKEADWIDGRMVPAGTVVKRGRIEPLSVLVGSGSIYRIIPCTEEAALKAVRTRRPLIVLRVPDDKQIEAPAVSAEDACEDCGRPESRCCCDAEMDDEDDE